MTPPERGPEWRALGERAIARPLEQIALNAIRYRARDDNDGKLMVQGDRRWLLRYIEQAERDLGEALPMAAMLDDELRRVEQGLSTAHSLERARRTYRAFLARHPQEAPDGK